MREQITGQSGTWERSMSSSDRRSKKIKMLMMQRERVIAVMKNTAGLKKILDHELSKIFSKVHCFSIL